MKALSEFMSSQSIWMYLFVFVGETVYTTLAILRSILVNRGEKGIGAFIAFFEVMLWAVVTSTVLTGITSDPIKLVVYGAAYALGQVLGAFFEGRLALGMISLFIFLPADETVEIIISTLREHGYGATILDATGILYAHRKVIIVTAKRKNKKPLVQMIEGIAPHAFISENAVTSTKGGYLKRGKAH